MSVCIKQFYIIRYQVSPKLLLKAAVPRFGAAVFYFKKFCPPTQRLPLLLRVWGIVCKQDLSFLSCTTQHNYEKLPAFTTSFAFYPRAVRTKPALPGICRAYRMGKWKYDTQRAGLFRRFRQRLPVEQRGNDQ